MAMLEVKNLSKSFGQLDVLKDISFSVEKGDVIAIIGPSGSGKSTLLRCINQLEKANGGVIKICGLDMLVKNEKGKTVYADSKTLRDIRLKIGLVFQNFNLFPHFSVLRNITEAPVRVLKQNKADAEKKAMELLGKMGLADKAKSYPCELSGGQQQRVSIARALINRPQIVFADEPTGNLDRANADEVLELLLKTKEELGQTLLIVTHDMKIAERADRILVMDNGVLSPYRKSNN